MTKFLDSTDDDVTFRATILDAIIFLRALWSNVSAATITNCLRHCGFSQNPEPPITPEENGEEQEEQEEEGENTSGEGDLLDRLRAITADSTPEEVMEEWVTCDEGLPTSSELTDAEIIQLAQDKTRDDSSPHSKAS